MEGYDERTYGDRFAPVYDRWYEGITDAAACAALVADLADLSGDAGGGPVLELGVGTGRLALPLAGLGLEVVGVDSSRAMLERLVANATAADADVEAVEADMVDPPLGDRSFAVVLLAYNTLFNLVDDGAQQRCLAAAAGRLLPGGSVVVEAFVPDDRDDGAGGAEVRDEIALRSMTADDVVLSISRSDPATQQAQGQYVDISEAGISLRPWRIRWQTPEQLDELAAAAGLVLADRWADWDRTPFGPDAAAHVSRYVLA
ncbi:MAG: class I SAM-dependent methyltransferase [Acidimicrobiales bacterium]|nr:class I SAM-dependent methyltransferase [Acidimicrobiales bacterium]